MAVDDSAQVREHIAEFRREQDRYRALLQPETQLGDFCLDWLAKTFLPKQPGAGRRKAAVYTEELCYLQSDIVKSYAE